MPEATLKSTDWKGKQVAVTGRLASMTRSDLAALMQSHGGKIANKVSRQTAFLIVGQEGLPLEADGALTANLRLAQSLQQAGHTICILTEDELLSKLGLDQHSEASRQLYNMSQLSRLANVSGARLRKWVQQDLIHPVQTGNGIALFDYAQVVSVKTLCNLIQRGVNPNRLRRSISQLKRWLPNAAQPLLQLAVLESNGELLVRLEDGLSEPTGQRCFDFDEPSDAPTLSMSQGQDATNDWFQQACDHEDAGQFEEAAQAYRQALLLNGPNPNLCFNLGNVLVQLNQKAEAAERYYQVVELDRGFAQAWNNLGVVLNDLRRTQESMAAFANAVAADPSCQEAHYNLGDLLDEVGKQSEAISHWKWYLAQDSQSEWAKYARKRLAAFGS